MDNGYLVPTTRWSQLTARAQQLTREASRFMHERPLQVIALTVGVGFVVGKLISVREQ